MKELLEIFAMVAQMANVEVMTPPFQLTQYGIAKPFEGTVYSELSILTEVACIIWQGAFQMEQLEGKSSPSKAENSSQDAAQIRTDITRKLHPCN